MGGSLRLTPWQGGLMTGGVACAAYQTIPCHLKIMAMWRLTY